MSWRCLACETENSDDLRYCEVCGADKYAMKHIMPRIESNQDSDKKSEFLETESKVKNIQAELDAWVEASKLNSVHGYWMFLRKYPYSRYKDIANYRLKVCQESEEAWRKAKSLNTFSAINGFIKNYPDSIHGTEARAILKEIRAWKIAENRNTVDSYKSYLSCYPNGIYAEAAKIKIKESNASSRVICIILLILLLVIVLFILVANILKNNEGATILPSQIQSGQQVNAKQQTGSTYYISEDDMRELEAKTDKLIRAMEVAKSIGDVRDANAYRQAQQYLDDLKKYDSQKYNSLKTRYNAL